MNLSMKGMKVGIVDYQMGNLASVSKALSRIGTTPIVSDDQSVLSKADLLVLPGVGNFTAGMANISSAGLQGFVTEWAAQGRRLLGICLGMQLLFEHSEEGDTKGLGVLNGSVHRLHGAPKIPHMGWNQLIDTSGTFRNFEGSRFYFVHSYICRADGELDASAAVTYGSRFTAALQKGNVTGVQFHPEKSSSDGLALLGALVAPPAPSD